MQSERSSSPKLFVYFLVPAPPGISPGQRFRFEQYLSFLSESGIGYRCSAFYTYAGWRTLFRHGNYLAKIGVVLRGFCIRFADLFRLSGADYVFVYREAAPLGPPVFEWIIAKLLRKKVIYDFDDAIWVPFSSQYNKVARSIRWFGKVAAICRWAHRVSVGNEYLAAYARKANSEVVIIPTVVDTALAHNRLQDQSTSAPVIGWTGTFSTLKYLDIVLPVLQRLQQRHEFAFVVIADKDPQLPLRNYRFVPWRKDSETDDLMQMHIGLMPLYDDEMSRGKCGFKAIQYMALGIPAVVSPVGVNEKIVDDGVNGFICRKAEEWETRLEALLADPGLRGRMGTEARGKVEANYSVVATREDFVRLFSQQNP